MPWSLLLSFVLRPWRSLILVSNFKGVKHYPWQRGLHQGPLSWIGHLKSPWNKMGYIPGWWGSWKMPLKEKMSYHLLVMETGGSSWWLEICKYCTYLKEDNDLRSYNLVSLTEVHRKIRADRLEAISRDLKELWTISLD